MKVIAFIPARLESKRFPNKVLRLIHGIPMIEHVRRRAILSKAFNKVIVVTNSKIIKKKLSKYNAQIKLTKKRHLNGTSRVSEISKNYKFDYCCILFADEPFIHPSKLLQSMKKLKKKNNLSYNIVTNLKINDMKSKQVVKAISDKNNFIFDYFRNTNKKFLKKKIKKSSGILIFKKKIIDSYHKLKIGIKERKHKIEQFRLIENNIKIKSIFIKNIYPSINTKKEFKNLISLINKKKEEVKILNKIVKIEN